MIKFLLFYLAFFTLIGFVSAQFELDSNTVALWHFDENLGSTAFDETTNDNDGAINGATWTAEGKFDNALNFDGLNDLVAVPYSQSIGELPELTLEAWIKRNSQADGMVISKNGPYFLSVRNNVLEGGIYAGPGWIHVNGTSKLEVEKWHHVALTYNGSFVKVYLNGLEDGSEIKTGSILVTSQGLHMGWGEPGHNQYFNGTIDEVRISNISRASFNISEENSLEDRVSVLEAWRETLDLMIDMIKQSIQDLFEITGNHTEQLNDYEQRIENLEQNQNSSNSTFPQAFNYLSWSERKNVVCGYAESHHLSSVQELGWGCELTYRQTSNGEKANCRCKKYS